MQTAFQGRCQVEPSRTHPLRPECAHREHPRLADRLAGREIDDGRGNERIDEEIQLVDSLPEGHILDLVVAMFPALQVDDRDIAARHPAILWIGCHRILTGRRYTNGREAS